MKAFLLAAGKGVRLRPLTDQIPKCLVPINGKPLIQIWLEHLARHKIDHILINTHHHAEQVEAFVKQRVNSNSLLVNGERNPGMLKSWDARIKHKEESETWPKVRLSYEEELLGSAGTVWSCRDFVEKDEEFWVIYSDNLSRVNLMGIYASYQVHGGLGTIGLFRTERPNECGIALLDETEKVIEFEEKPVKPKSNLANAGIYLFKREVFDQVRWDFPLPMDFGYHILPQLVGKMYGYVINDYHLDIGTPKNYRRALENYGPRSLTR